MSKQTYIDELIEFKEKVILAIANSQKVMGLLGDDPDIDIDGEEAEKLLKRNIFDYDYVSSTVQRSDSYIMVEVKLAQPTSGSIYKWYVYVQVVCYKDNVPLDKKKKFKGVKGNRRDNLVREIDYLLNGSTDFGIGKLNLIHAAPASVPEEFTSVMLTYEINDFRNERLMKRGA